MADHMTAEQLHNEFERVAEALLSAEGSPLMCEHLSNEISRLAARLSGMAVVPKGWKLVPLLPTEQQMRAAESAITEGACANPPTSGCGRCHRTAYDAAVSAAPEPPHV